MRIGRRGIVVFVALGALTPPALATAGSDVSPTARERAGEHDAERLLPETVAAFEAAAAAAADAGHTLEITSGYRTPERQQELFDEAVAKYGSEELASQWVLPPDETAHVRGTAIDVGPREAAAWLEEHGHAHGLCRTYANEWWHFELVPGAVEAGRCPPMAETA